LPLKTYIIIVLCDADEIDEMLELVQELQGEEIDDTELTYIYYILVRSINELYVIELDADELLLDEVAIELTEYNDAYV